MWMNRTSVSKMLGSAVANDCWLYRVSRLRLPRAIGVHVSNLPGAVPRRFGYLSLSSWSCSRWNSCASVRLLSTDQSIAGNVSALGGTKCETTADSPSHDKKINRRPYYFDYQATTPLDPRVLDKMMPFNVDCFANAHSSSHASGWEAKREVELAR